MQIRGPTCLSYPTGECIVVVGNCGHKMLPSASSLTTVVSK